MKNELEIFAKDPHGNPAVTIDEIIRIAGQFNKFKEIELHGKSVISRHNGRELMRVSDFLVELSPQRDNPNIIESFFSADTLVLNHNLVTNIKGCCILQ